MASGCVYGVHPTIGFGGAVAHARQNSHSTHLCPCCCAFAPLARELGPEHHQDDQQRKLRSRSTRRPRFLLLDVEADIGERIHMCIIVAIHHSNSFWVDVHMLRLAIIFDSTIVAISFPRSVQEVARPSPQHSALQSATVGPARRGQPSTHSLNSDEATKHSPTHSLTH